MFGPAACVLRVFSLVLILLSTYYFHYYLLILLSVLLGILMVQTQFCKIIGLQGKRVVSVDCTWNRLPHTHIQLSLRADVPSFGQWVTIFYRLNF